jgi:hypothetical protein
MITQYEIEKAASASITRYNHKDMMVQYEMRKCGKLSFIEGASWAISKQQAENEALLKELNDYKAMLENFADYSNPNEPDRVAAPYGTVMKLAREVLKKYWVMAEGGGK